MNAASLMMSRSVEETLRRGHFRATLTQGLPVLADEQLDQGLAVLPDQVGCALEKCQSGDGPAGEP